MILTVAGKRLARGGDGAHLDTREASFERIGKA